jgi:hypothetical protein
MNKGEIFRIGHVVDGENEDTVFIYWGFDCNNLRPVDPAEVEGAQAIVAGYPLEKLIQISKCYWHDGDDPFADEKIDPLTDNERFLDIDHGLLCGL